MLKIKISIVIGTFNRKRMLTNCIGSIRKNAITVPYEIIVVDGGSNDGTHKWLFKQKDVLTIVHHNRINLNGRMFMKKSWAYFMNLAFKSAEGDYICMLSDDCFIHPGAIMNGLEILEKNKGNQVGGCAFPFRDSLMNDEYLIYKSFGKFFINHGIFRKEILEQIGWIDENNFKFYLADTDLSLKIWDRGYSIIVSMNSLVEHLQNEFDHMRDINKRETEHNRDYTHFMKIWASRFETNTKELPIEKMYLGIIIPNELSAYIPKGLRFKTLLLDRWLKNYINKEFFLYSILRKLKWLFRG